MVRRNGLALIAACAALACGEMVRAGAVTDAAATQTPPAVAVTPATGAAALGSPLLLDDATTMPTSGPATAASTTATTTPLMGVLESLGVGKGLEAAGINVYGWVQGSWTYDTSAPPGNIITDRAFDTKDETLLFNQVDITVNKSNDYTKGLDVGFTLENMYGYDAAYIHSNGLSIQSPGRTASPIPGSGGTALVHPKTQYDLTQANFVISTSALAKGVAFEGGKFATLLGYEVIDAYSPTAQNQFYSHSYIFTQEPFTHTGALGIVNLNEAFTFTGGITRGWDQATNDSNGNIDFIGQVKWAANSKTTLYLNGITGNEEPSGAQDGYRTVIDFVGQYAASDQLSLGVNGMYAWEPQTGNGGAGGGTGQWYAVAAYASYKQSDFLTLNARGEWFDDQDGAAPTQYDTALLLSGNYARTIGRPNEYYEVTLGATVHPFPNNQFLNNFFLRPEIRFDYADKATYDGGTDHYFFTAAVDGVVAF